MNKITKKRICLILAILSIVGAFTCFYGTNLVMASVVHKDLPLLTWLVTFMPSVTFLIITFDIILFIFLFVRLYLHPTHEKRMIKVYGFTLSAFSILGIVLCTLSGVFHFKGNFLEDHPFYKFHIFMYIYHILMLGLGLLMILWLPKKVINDDIIIHKNSVLYVLKTMLLSVIYFIALNRLGAFLLSPMYIQWSSISLTYPAYIACILPAVILVNDLIYVMGGYKKSPAAGIVVSSFVAFFSIFFFGQIIYRGTSNQLFIQLVSPINPIGRLLTFPYDTVLQMIVAFGLGTFTLINSVVFKRQSDFDKLPYELKRAKIEGRIAKFNQNKTRNKSRKK